MLTAVSVGSKVGWLLESEVVWIKEALAVQGVGDWITEDITGVKIRVNVRESPGLNF